MNLQGNYHSSTTADFGDPVMYTQAGIITDEAFIKNYVTRKSVAELFNFETNTQTVQTDLLNINIDANAKVTGRMYVEGLISKFVDIKSFVASQSATDALIQASKRDTVFSYFGGYNIGPSIGKTQPVFSYFPLPSAAGGGGFLVTLSQFRLVIKNNELYLPQLGFYYYYGSKNGYQYGNSMMYDVVNPDLTKELFSRDTIVVQQRLIKLTK